MKEIKAPVAPATDPVTELSIVQSFNRAILHFQAPFESSNSDQSTQIPDPHVKQFLIYLKEGSESTYILHSIIYPPMTTIVVKNPSVFLDSWSRITARVYCVDHSGKKTAYTQATSSSFSAMPLTGVKRMAESITINEGNGVYIDTSGYIALAPADGSDCIGVALETVSSGAGEHPWISYVLQGKVTCIFDQGIDTDPAAGDGIMIGGTAGEFTVNTDTGVNVGGISANRRKGVALEAKNISADDEVDIFFTP